MGQTHRISRNHTAITKRPNGFDVILHHTTVVFVTDGHVTLNSGGWRTTTTKARMNQTANQYSLPFHVSQKDGAWSVNINGTVRPFVDGMTFAAR